MLHFVNDAGHIAWHCQTPHCGYHNCAAWHPAHVCAHHSTARIEGRTLTAHISHDDVRWVSPDVVALPPCPNCGATMFIKVHFTEAELAAPNMMIRPGVPHPAIALHGELASHLKAHGKEHHDRRQPAP